MGRQVGRVGCVVSDEQAVGSGVSLRHGLRGKHDVSLLPAPDRIPARARHSDTLDAHHYDFLQPSHTERTIPGNSSPPHSIGRINMQTRLIKLPQYGRRLIQHRKDPLSPFDQQGAFLLDLLLGDDPPISPAGRRHVLPSIPVARWCPAVFASDGGMEHLSRTRKRRRCRRKRNWFLDPIRMFTSIMIRHPFDRRQRRQRKMIPRVVVSPILIPRSLGIPMVPIRAVPFPPPAISGRGVHPALAVAVRVGRRVRVAVRQRAASWVRGRWTAGRGRASTDRHAWCGWS